MIDFHCHVDLYPNPVELISQIDRAGIYVLAVTTTPKSWPHLQKLLVDRKKIKAAVGLHPELVHERHSEVDEVCQLIRETKYVGEVGIDGSDHLKNSYGLQIEVFKTILNACAVNGGKIISIHSRRAATDVLKCLEEVPTAGQPVLHWFSGTAKELRRACEIGAWFSVGPAMLQSAKGKQLLNEMPRDRILTETDGPFGCLGKIPLSPKDVALAISQIAEIWGVPIDDVSEQISQNFKALLTK